MEIWQSNASQTNTIACIYRCVKVLPGWKQQRERYKFKRRKCKEKGRGEGWGFAMENPRLDPRVYRSGWFSLLLLASTKTSHPQACVRLRRVMASLHRAFVCRRFSWPTKDTDSCPHCELFQGRRKGRGQKRRKRKRSPRRHNSFCLNPQFKLRHGTWMDTLGCRLESLSWLIQKTTTLLFRPLMLMV